MLMSWYANTFYIFLLAFCEGNLLVSKDSPCKEQMVQGFDVFFDISLNKLFNKQLCYW